MRILRALGSSVFVFYIVCTVFAVVSFGSGQSVASEAVSPVVVEKQKADGKGSESGGVVAEAAEAIPDWAEFISALIALAGVITAVTPTPKDNAVLIVVRKVLDVLALNVGGAKNAAAERDKNRFS